MFGIDTQDLAITVGPPGRIVEQCGQQSPSGHVLGIGVQQIGKLKPGSLTISGVDILPDGPQGVKWRFHCLKRHSLGNIGRQALPSALNRYDTPLVYAQFQNQ